MPSEMDKLVNPLSPFTLASNSFKGFKQALAVIRGPGSFEDKFAGVIKAAAPQVPDIGPLPAIRDKICDILAPMVVQKYLPPMPSFLGKIVKGR
jgi:hypothetical protein